MRSLFILILILMLVPLSLVACSPASEVEQETVSPTITQSDQNLSPTPTPKPTLSEEEIKNREEYNKLMNICVKYNDWSAVLLVRQMLTAGKISDDQFSKLYSIPAFSGMQDFDEGMWKRISERLQLVSNVLNDKSTDIDEETFIQSLSDTLANGTVYLMLFDSEEKQERMIKGIEIIDKCFEETSDENCELLRQSYFSDSLTPGEIVLLYYYIQNSPRSINKDELEDHLGINEFEQSVEDALAYLFNQ